MIASQVPNDADGTEMVVLPEVEDLLDDLGRGLIGVRLSDRLLADQPGITLKPVGGGLSDVLC